MIFGLTAPGELSSGRLSLIAQYNRHSDGSIFIPISEEHIDTANSVLDILHVPNVQHCNITDIEHFTFESNTTQKDSKDSFVLYSFNETDIVADIYHALTGYQLEKNCQFDFLADMFRAGTGPKYAMLFVDRTISTQQINTLNKSLVDSHNQCCVGLIGPGDKSLCWLMAIKSFLYTYCDHRQTAPESTYINAISSEHEELETSSYQWLQGIKDEEKIKKALSNPKDLLLIIAHSNGVDMGISKGVALCAKKDFNKAVVPLKAMECFHTDSCIRCQNKDNRIAPSSIKANTLFLYTCWGAMIGESVFDLDISLFKALISAPGVGSLLTTYTMSNFDPRLALDFGKKYAAGEALGSITTELNRVISQLLDKSGDRVYPFLLIGDPSYLKSQYDEQAHSKFSDQLSWKNKNSERSTDHKLATLYDDIKIDDFQYTDASIMGSVILPSDAIKDSVTRLNNSKRGLLTYLIVNNYFDTNDYAERGQASDARIICKHFMNIHKAWIKMYLEMVSAYGGYIRLQIDRFYKELPEQKTDSAACHYCSAHVIIRNLAFKDRSNDTSRILGECVNCGTVLDAALPVTHAKICGNNKVIEGKGSFSVSLGFSEEQKGLATLVGILEPFDKKNKDAEIVFSTTQSFKGSTLEKNFELAMEKANAPVGHRYLNVLSLINGKPVFLRRSIYFWSA